MSSIPPSERSIIDLAVKRAGIERDAWLCRAATTLARATAWSIAEAAVDALLERGELELAPGRRVDLVFELTGTILGLGELSTSKIARALSTHLEHAPLVVEIYGTATHTQRVIRNPIDRVLAESPRA